MAVLDQDVLAGRGCKGGVLRVKVMGRADINGLHPGVRGGFRITSERSGAMEHLGVGLGFGQVTAGEVEVYLGEQRLNGGGEGLGKAAATDNA